MKLLQFGDLSFPYNPHLIKISMSQPQAVYTLPYKGQMSQPIGKALTRVEGEGEFLEGADQGLQSNLTRCFEGQTKAMLCVPDCTPFWARLTALEFTGVGGRSSYTFKFIFTEVNSQEVYTQSINMNPFGVV